MPSSAHKKAGAVDPYIYEYKPDGKTVLGYQVRFKRTKEGETDTTSQYFSVSTWGTKEDAFVEAKKWRDKNWHWLTDWDFEIKGTSRRRHKRFDPVVAARKALREKANAAKKVPKPAAKKRSGPRKNGVSDRPREAAVA